jgi:hypothetical protein
MTLEEDRGEKEASVSSVDDQPRLTLAEVKTGGLPAFWLGENEEFLFKPDTGEILWHPWADLRPCGEPMHAWHDLPPDKAVPESGWIHWPED